VGDAKRKDVRTVNNHYSNKDRNDMFKQSAYKSKTGRGSAGNLIQDVNYRTNFNLMAGVFTNSNSNHHYGVFFNTDAVLPQNSEMTVKDKKRMKNLKHMKK
jgi:hypothetical protein